MLDKLAKLQRECEKLGLVEEARTIQAWLSTELPYLSEESRVVKEVYSIFERVARLPPSSVPATSFSLKSLVYNTEGKQVRQIVGELGYILSGVYSKGYNTHSTANFTKGMLEKHVNFGSLLKEIIGLIGTYYTMTKYGGGIFSSEEQLEQQFQLVNNKIVSLFKKLEEALVRVRGHAMEMLSTQSNIRKQFYQSDEALVKQADDFFNDINDLLFTIRRFFYHRARLTKDDIQQAIALLSKLKEFFSNLERIGSGLDLSGGRFSFPALLFWSTVFAEGAEGKRSGAQQQREALEEVSSLPYLQRYSDVIETGSPLMKEKSKDVQKFNREFTQVLQSYVEVNSKLREFKEVLTDRADFLVTVTQYLKNLEKERLENKTALSDKKVPGIVLGPTSLTEKAGASLFTIFPDLSKTSFPENYIKEGKSFAELIKRAETLERDTRAEIEALQTEQKKADITDQDVVELQSSLFVLSQRLSKIATNPMEYLHPYEQFWTSLLSFGKVYAENGEISDEFKNLANTVYQSRQVLPDDLQDEVGLGLGFIKGKNTQEKTEELAKQVSSFNGLIKNLLAGEEVDLPKEKLQDLERFIQQGSKESKEWGIEVLDKASNNAVEMSRSKLWSADGDPLQEHIDKLLKLPDTFNEWLSGSRRTQSERITPRKVKAEIETHNWDTTFEVHFNVKDPKPEGPIAFKILTEISGNPQRRSFEGTLLAVDSKGEVSELDTVSIPASDDSPYKYTQWITKRTQELSLEYPLNTSIQEVLKTIFGWVLEQNKKENAEGEEIDEALDAIEEPLEVEEEMVTREGVEPPVTTLPKAPSKDVFRIKDVPLSSSEDKESEKEGRIRRLVTLRQRVSTFDLTLPESETVQKYTRILASRRTELLRTREHIRKMSEEYYKKLKQLAEKLNEELFESDVALPVLPRVIYSVYSPTKKAKQTWNKWKQQKIELPMHELGSLLSSLEEYKEIASQAQEEEDYQETKVPLVTIDFIERKFEELKKLAS